MDRRFLTVLGISLVFALVVSSVFYQMSSKANGGGAKPVQTQVDTQDVVVAARALSLGGAIKADDVKVVKIAASAFPKGAFSKPEEVIDRPIISNILVDEPVLDGRLGPRGSGVGIVPMIPPGMRAVSVRVNEVVNVSGFVLPGMHVDVLVTGRPGGDSAATMTQTVLQDITVLSAGTTVQADPRGQPINAQSVTLLVTPDQAEVLTLAGNESRIQLVLRNGADTQVATTKGVNVRELFKLRGRGAAPPPGEGAPPPEDEERPKPKPRPAVVEAPLPPPPPVAVAPPPPPPQPDSVVVIRGNQKSVEIIQQRPAPAKGDY